MDKYEWVRATEQLETVLVNTANALRDFAKAWHNAMIETSVEHKGGTEDVSDFTPSDN